MKKLTVFTPTFNRAYCLSNCYESLIRQTNKDFIWLIIDDGSTDNTKDLVSIWQTERLIEIQYIWQENQGMHGAHNTAYELIETELNVCIDSDDYMPDDAVEKIIMMWEKHGSQNVSGIIGLDSNFDGKVIGSLLPTNLKTSTLFDLYYKYGVSGDKKLVYRTDLTKEFPYPIFKNEKYVGLAYKYYKLDQKYTLLLMNEVLCCVEYLPDGSSLNMLRQYQKNPKGFAFYRKELMKLPFVNGKFKFRQAVHYVSSCLLDKNFQFIKEAPNKSLTTIAVPLGIILFLFIKTKTRTI
ncbi:beta-glycosyltransferase [Bacillus sp. 17376]|uniref:Beta-glycosyltransferase n=1 Tax=Mesobacillus boroniphilus JCM 21738 TaxID=1294265 RepID=W4RJ47_9BACI|nr:glycosyltransferase family 2 protein [Mesobacillus boroniphilus]ESU32064.1 beta-glycosyltransferase [Bacillus sp. 17376]GAE44172.1 beta-glycosyltransferase [Mesobacillus boroniphilus JCM 21738]